MNLVNKVKVGNIKLGIETISNKLKKLKDSDVSKKEEIINGFKNKIKNDNEYLYFLNRALSKNEIDLHIKLLLQEYQCVFLKVEKINEKSKMVVGKVSLTNSDYYFDDSLMIVGLENISDIVVF